MKRNNETNTEALLQQYRETVAKQNQMIDELNDKIKAIQKNVANPTKLSISQMFDLITHLPDDVETRNKRSLNYDYKGIKGTCYINVDNNTVSFKFIDATKENYYKQTKISMDDLTDGTKVRIRNDLVVNKRYGSNYFVASMKPFLGQVVTIICSNKNAKSFIIAGSFYTFTLEMVDSIVEKSKNYAIDDLKIGQTIRLKNDLVVGRKYGNAIFVDSMKKYVDKDIVIDTIDRDKRIFGIVGSIYQFTPEMIDSISDAPLKTVNSMNDKFRRNNDELSMIILATIASKNPEVLKDEKLAKKAIDEFFDDLSKRYKHD